MASTNYRFYQLKDENSPLFDSITGSTNFELGFNIGYFYNWIFIKSFYLALGASPGFGFTHALVDQSTTDGIQESRYTTGVFRLSAHTGLGYNGERLTVGIYANFSGGAFLADDIPVINTHFRNLYQVFLTYRLEVNKKVRVNRML